LKERSWLKAIALWQITGGAAGGVMFLDAVPRLQLPTDSKWTLLGIFVPICVFSVVTGWALLHGRAAARVPSIILHAVQLLGVGTTHFTFRLVLGPFLYLYVTRSTFGINAGFQPEMRWHTSGPMPYEPHVVINLLSLTCIVLLIRWRYP